MDVKIGTDKGVLRLQFSTKVSQTYYNRRQFYKSLNRTDEPDNRQWALDICRKIQIDLDHPDNLFDPTLGKYLGFKVNLSFLENTQAVKLGELYEEYINWKFKCGKIAETTFLTTYKRMYFNWLKPYLEEASSAELVNKIAQDLLAQGACKINIKRLFSALSDMGDRAVRKKTLTKNYFYELKEIDLRITKKSNQLLEEEDYRAFTLEERDIILNAFRASSNKKTAHIADLVEFLFLTGCRMGEAFALKWNDIKKESIVFDESYSSETKITKEPKTKVIRIFRTKGYQRLTDLLNKIKSNKVKTDNNDYVFLNINEQQYERFQLNDLWYGKNTVRRGEKVLIDGIVKQLAREGKISQYLKPSSTRHTFITLQAQAGVDLKLLADSCGNSVDTIYDHYLGANRNAVFINM
ncbi:integrase [Aphanothece hegewaldii CCALA 016]|uniref:Integrase n=1 Tax=Aphanothece hegewaldii CCALA 016 TaxID=2107694 RepID=A0A2T1LQY1_9CHRO|nr:tyrosine-type recombinase/integrase [Aphanothece hegewaldii]PSF29696.1 integrase [Aphanothece hegewaldii CCALA 016]